MTELPVPPAIAKIAADGKLSPRQKRRFLIEISLRKQKPGTGSAHEFMLRRTAMHQWPDLRDILKGFEWLIVGGVATRAYMPERATKDLDILVRESVGAEVIETLKQNGYEVVSKLAVNGYLLRSPEGVEVDVLFGTSPWLDEALASPGFDPAAFPVLKLPYLVLMKLEANRARDVGDITTMLGWTEDENQLDAVRDAVTRFSPEDAEDIESLIFLGRKEREIPSNDS